MKFLFLHPNFPAQFRHLAVKLAEQGEHQVVFGTARIEGSLPGVHKKIYTASREVNPETHHYIKPFEHSILQGQAVYRMANELKRDGFVPDIIYGHSGWGPTLFIKDIFPKSKLFCYFEWFYRACGSDVDFDPAEPITDDDVLRIRIKNSTILQDLHSCDRGLSPTAWQQQQFPPEYRQKLTVHHDGIDTNFFRPHPGAKLVLPSKGLDLSHVAEIVTYSARGLEPYRGFPQFIEAIALLLERRPNTHVVIVGEDRVCYGRQLANDLTYQQLMLAKFPLDLSRVHFVGWLSYPEYLQVLQASSAHVYLTYPFVLSWSMLEALATGCLVIGSSTAPVMEIIQDQVNGLLVDFFDPEDICARIEAALEHPDQMAEIRDRARASILAQYNLADLLSQHVRWLLQDE
jgi:glycosyltransferase involved in cell wall biosynthesis